MMHALTAIGIGWGVFWLMMWCALAALCLTPPRRMKDADTLAVALIGVFAALAWIIAVLVMRSML